MDWKGRTVRDTGKGNTGGAYTLPIMWMSYGANAMAGLKNTKGSVALIREAGKLGVFPQKLGSYQADYLIAAPAQNGPFTPLHFLHGGRSSELQLRGGDFTEPNRFVQSSILDKDHQARTRINVGFTDGHAEAVQFIRMLRPNSSLWPGVGQGLERVFD